MTEASSQTKPRVFLSCSRGDTALVDEIVISIEGYGFDIVIDSADLFPGEPWEPRLHRMITEADSTVCVVSQN
ncbi:MAG: toll/interleukin-1 receptor domain-containing protein [Hyphomonadaceae bacterium]